MSARTIALQLRTLAADPESQGLLLQESSCLSGLVALLHADNDEDVLILSLQALAFLAANPSHHAALVNQPGLILALSSLTEKTAVVLKTLAQNVIAALEGYINGGGNGGGNGGSSGTATPGNARGRTASSASSRAGSRGNTRPTTPSTGGREASSGSIGTLGNGAHNFVPRYLQHVVFQITPAANSAAAGGGGVLDKSGQLDVEKALVAIKGVVSVAYAAGGSKSAGPTFTLYTSLKPAVLAPLVSKALTDLAARAGAGAGRELVANMISKDKSAAGQQQEADKENQENTQQPQQATAATTTSAAPGYLQKSTASAGGAPGYIKKSTASATPAASSSSSSSSTPGYLTSASSSSAASSGGSRALAAHATASSSSDSASNLAARYQSAAAKKKAEQAAAAAAAATPKKAGLLSSVTSYFW